MRTALLIVLGLLGVALVAFQVYAAVSVHRSGIRLPRSVTIIRGLNLALLAIALAIAAWALATR